ncbi:MAG: S8 family peptidase, partial [Calditrichaceae bacterium]
NGTSFSCPLAAGAIALMLNAYPQLTPEKIFDAITSTASQADHPDRLLGWGILDIEAAYYAIDTSDLEETRDKIFPEFIRLEQNYPNPFNIETTISYSLKNHANVVINIYDLQGRLVASFPQGLKRSIKLYQFRHDFSRQASGIYFYQIKATEIYTSHKFVKSKKMVLLK